MNVLGEASFAKARVHLISFSGHEQASLCPEIVTEPLTEWYETDFLLSPNSSDLGVEQRNSLSTGW